MTIVWVFFVDVLLVLWVFASGKSNVDRKLQMNQISDNHTDAVLCRTFLSWSRVETVLFNSLKSICEFIISILFTLFSSL